MKEPTPHGGRAVLVLQTGNTLPFLTSSVPEKNPLFPFAFFPLKFGRWFVTEQPAAVCKVNTFLFTPASTCSVYAEWSCEVCLGWWRREWGRIVFLLNIKIKRTWGQKATLFLTFTWLNEKQNQSDNEMNSTSELFKTMSTSYLATQTRSMLGTIGCNVHLSPRSREQHNLHNHVCAVWQANKYF